MIFALALVLAQLDAGSVEAAAAPPADAPVTLDAGSVSVVPAAEPIAAPPLVVAEGVAPSQFVKGELSVYLGSDRLSVKRNRAGVSLGVDFFKNTYFALVEPQLDLRFFDAKLGIGVGAPLRFEIFNFNEANGEVLGFKQAGRIRKEDYDTVHDFGRLLKYVNYGKKEDNFYVNIGQRYATSIGHGAIMRRYAPNIDVDYPRASAEVDYYNDYAGFEAFTNDVLEWNVLAAIAFVKPLSFFNKENLFTKSLSLGVTAAMDRNAPDTLVYSAATGARQLTSDDRLAATQRPVGLIGFDAEVKVVKTAEVDIKPYVDYSMMLGGGGGLTVGALGRFNVGKENLSAFRVVLEGRYLSNNYQPSYFDTFYEKDRYQARRVMRNGFGIFEYATKRQDVLVNGLGNRAGFYAEASWGVPGKVGFTVALEATSNSPQKNFVAHLEVPWLNFLQIFGSFYKRGFTDLSEFGKADENTVIFAGARLRTLPFLFINGRVYKTFRVSSEQQAYANQFGFSLDLEIGFEFGRSREEVEEEKLAPLGTPASDVPPPGDGPPPTPAPDPNVTPSPAPQPEPTPEPAPNGAEPPPKT